MTSLRLTKTAIALALGAMGAAAIGTSAKADQIVTDNLVFEVLPSDAYYLVNDNVTGHGTKEALFSNEAAAGLTDNTGGAGTVVKGTDIASDGLVFGSVTNSNSGQSYQPIFISASFSIDVSQPHSQAETWPNGDPQGSFTGYEVTSFSGTMWTNVTPSDQSGYTISGATQLATLSLDTNPSTSNGANNLAFLTWDGGGNFSVAFDNLGLAYTSAPPVDVSTYLDDNGGTSSAFKLDALSPDYYGQTVLQFSGNGSQNGEAGILFAGDVQVPEPSTIALLGTALIGIGFVGWRRQKMG